MSTNLMTGASLSNEEYHCLRKREMHEMQSIMDSIKNSKDKRILYRWRRPVIDIKQMLESSAELYGDKPMYHQNFDDGRGFVQFTYEEVLHDVQSLGTAMINLGLKGKNIGLIGDNRYEWAESYFAVTGGTGIAVPLDKELHESELEQLVVKGEIEAVVTMPGYCEIFKNIKERGNTNLKYIIDVGLDNDQEEHNEIISWKALRKKGKDLLESGDNSFKDARIVNTDPAVIMFTSGTTGVSKGVVLSNKNLCSNIMIAQSQLEVKPEDIFFSVLPIHHAYEGTCTMLESAYCGASVAFCRGLRYIVKDMQMVRPTMILAVPLIYEKFYNKIMRKLKKSGKDKQLELVFKMNRITKKVGIDIVKKIAKPITDTFGGRLRTMISGGAPIDTSIIEFFGELGMTSVQGYGLTECSPMVALTPDKKKYIKKDSAGRILDFTDCKISEKNENGIGEICFRGPNIMLGYYKDEEATNKALIDGWFHTGDMGYVDDDKYIYITGRKKNVIIAANGKNVYPEELETYLMKNSLIDECMVWEDDTCNDKTKHGICATIKPSEEVAEEMLGKDYSDAELKRLIWEIVDKVNEELPLFKKIKHIIIRKREFDKTTAQKIRRFVDDNKKA